MLIDFDECGLTTRELAEAILSGDLIILSRKEVEEQRWLAPFIAISSTPIEAVIAILGPSPRESFDPGQYRWFIKATKPQIQNVCRIVVEKINESSRKNFMFHMKSMKSRYRHAKDTK